MFFYISTIAIGWALVGNLIDAIIFFLGFDHELKSFMFAYIFIGYMVAMYCKIKMPLTQKPVNEYKKIEFKLFFKDIYYALWWPYYLWNRYIK